ncbi:hypothetical protein F511_36322 [Dorcoceras hygrometricum]|uniref:Uncharacterized protein n=1 Tax=Dorcoceras hygrometricum TaxID=472368 RepID=A0A2Z7BQF8_9LAMI|nr:hypothetical protein F511_36322 [Dorcoceras hygrometricum]
MYGCELVYSLGLSMDYMLGCVCALCCYRLCIVLISAVAFAYTHYPVELCFASYACSVELRVPGCYVQGRAGFPGFSVGRDFDPAGGAPGGGRILQELAVVAKLQIKALPNVKQPATRRFYVMQAEEVDPDTMLITGNGALRRVPADEKISIQQLYLLVKIQQLYVLSFVNVLPVVVMSKFDDFVTSSC